MKTEAEWAKTLSPETYLVMWKKGTEPPFSGKYYHNNEKGIYCCAACGNPLFNSETKYDSGSGWPSFYAPIQNEAVSEHLDDQANMIRTEITCTHCGGHLGHVFDDGPQPTGKRYCMNSVSLDFKKI